MRSFGRRSTNFSLSNIWEFYQLGKFNFDPEYQRSGDVWSEDKKSFLIDSIVKNFPLPPIFLHESIEEDSGKSSYDVIDGKQRLLTIIAFIKDEIFLPEDCSMDGLGISELDGKKFSDFKEEPLLGIKKKFWQYELTIEFIESNESEVIDSIFDRLNRNGEPLNAQELRNATYHSSSFYKSILNISKNVYIQELLFKLDKNRKEDVEFCSELYFTLIEGRIIDSNKQQLDEMYVKYCSDNKSQQELEQYELEFNEIVSILEKILSGFTKYYIYSVSHLYALWCLAWQTKKQGVDASAINSRIPDFYSKVKAKDYSEKQYISEYIYSMQQATKSYTSRNKRVNALLSCMEMNTI